MSYSLEVKEEARIEIIEATHWYAEKVAGLGIRFIEQLESIFNIILANPKTYKRVYKNFRQAALKKFPYVVVYEYETNQVII